MLILSPSSSLEVVGNCVDSQVRSHHRNAHRVKGKLVPRIPLQVKQSVMHLADTIYCKFCLWD